MAQWSQMAITVSLLRKRHYWNLENASGEVVTLRSRLQHTLKTSADMTEKTVLSKHSALCNSVSLCSNRIVLLNTQ